MPGRRWPGKCSQLPHRPYNPNIAVFLTTQGCFFWEKGGFAAPHQLRAGLIAIGCGLRSRQRMESDFAQIAPILPPGSTGAYVSV